MPLVLSPLRCVTCQLPLAWANDGEKSRLCHDATLREVVARSLFLRVPPAHNLRQHATQPFKEAS